MKSELDIPCASEVGFGTTILQPLLLTYQALSVPTLINFLSDIAPDGVHSSSFATYYETNSFRSIGRWV